MTKLVKVSHRTSIAVGRRKRVKLLPGVSLMLGWRKVFYPFGRPARRRRRS